MTIGRYWYVVIFFILNHSSFVRAQETAEPTEPTEQKPDYILEDIAQKEEELKKGQDLIRQKERSIMQLKQLPAWTPTNPETLLLQTQIDDLKKQNQRLEEELATALKKEQQTQDTQTLDQEMKKLEQEAQALYSSETEIEEEEEIESDTEELEALIKKCFEEWLERFIAPQPTQQWQTLTQQYNQAVQDLIEYEYKMFPNQQNWTPQQWEDFENNVIESIEKNKQNGSLNHTYYNLIKKVRFYKQQLENLSHKKLPLRPALDNECNELLKKMAKKKENYPN